MKKTLVLGIVTAAAIVSMTSCERELGTATAYGVPHDVVEINNIEVLDTPTQSMPIDNTVEVLL